MAEKTSSSTNIGIALAIWAAGLVVCLGLGLWNVSSYRQDAENRLISEAGRTAAQIAGLLSLPGTRPDSMNARALVLASMEDERIYAIRIQTKQGVMEGQRRNHIWEPIAWDDEIAENCVRGVNPVKISGKPAGIVEVWLSPRSSQEDASLLAMRERWGFAAFALLWTLGLTLVFWHWGIFRQLHKKWQQRKSSQETKEITGLENESCLEGEPDTGLISANAGHKYQSAHPDSWLVTAGMFRQTFAHAPHLINRLYAEGEIAGLCHLGRMLEQAAPCIGAEPLAKAAHAMQTALNDPDCEARGLPVEECVRILDQTLAALGCQTNAQPAVNTGS